MSKAIDFYYDFLSPYSYLALTRLPALASRSDARVIYRPIEVLKVMEQAGNSPTTVLCPAKGRYAVSDLARWAQAYGVPLNRNPHHRQIDGGALLRGAVLAGRQGRIEAYTEVIFRGMWVGQAAFADDGEIAGMLDEAGFAGAAAMLADQAQARAELDSNNDAAVAAGVFGVPSFVVDGELFFGNDRLQFLEAALHPQHAAA